MGKMLSIFGGVALGGIGCLVGISLLGHCAGGYYRDQISNYQTIRGTVVDEDFDSSFFGSIYGVSIVNSDTGKKVAIQYDSAICGFDEPRYLNTLFKPGDLVELRVGESESEGITGGQVYVGTSGKLADTPESKQ